MAVQVGYCAWCADPNKPSRANHPGGQLEHVPRIDPRLHNAVKLIEEAERLIGSFWRDVPAGRTPRLAEAVSLLDRCKGKLQKEAILGKREAGGGPGGPERPGMGEDQAPGAPPGLPAVSPGADGGGGGVPSANQ